MNMFILFLMLVACLVFYFFQIYKPEGLDDQTRCVNERRQKMTPDGIPAMHQSAPQSSVQSLPAASQGAGSASVEPAGGSGSRSRKSFDDILAGKAKGQQIDLLHFKPGTKDKEKADAEFKRMREIARMTREDKDEEVTVGSEPDKETEDRDYGLDASPEEEGSTAGNLRVDGNSSENQPSSVPSVQTAKPSSSPSVSPSGPKNPLAAPSLLQTDAVVGGAQVPKTQSDKTSHRTGGQLGKSFIVDTQKCFRGTRFVGPDGKDIQSDHGQGQAEEELPLPFTEACVYRTAVGLMAKTGVPEPVSDRIALERLLGKLFRLLPEQADGALVMSNRVVVDGDASQMVQMGMLQQRISLHSKVCAVCLQKAGRHQERGALAYLMTMELLPAADGLLTLTSAQKMAVFKEYRQRCSEMLRDFRILLTVEHAEQASKPYHIHVLFVPLVSRSQE